MDISMHYVERGIGEPLVLLHGNGESSEYFKPQIEFFSASYRVIAVDTRGHGKSPRGKGRFSLSRFADDLKELLDELGINNANILGFSDGGNIALLFTLRYPGYVRRLILNGANLYPAGMKSTVWLLIFFSWCLESIGAVFSRRSARERELLSLMLLEPHIKPTELSSVDIPVLVIAGSHDMIRKGHTKKIHLSLKKGSLVILHGSHFVAAENSEAFNEAVFKFLSR